MSSEELLHEGLTPTPGKRIRRGPLQALTGIRIFAALWVMMFHFGAAFTARAHMPRFITTFLEHGEFGVALFFTLSGFILFYTYQGNLQTRKDLYGFFVARLARLYPVYLLAIAYSALFQGRLPHGKELLIFPLLQAWTPPVSFFGYTWIIQTWTLSVEAFFYCCFPLLLLLFRRRWPIAWLWSATAVLLAVNVALQSPLVHPGMPPTWINRTILQPVLCLPEFAFGMLLGAIFMHKRNADPEARTNDWITFGGILLFSAPLALGMGSYLVCLSGLLCFGWAIYRLSHGRGWLTSLLSTPFMLLLGGASYTVYIMQVMVRFTLYKLFHPLHPGLDAALSPFVLVGLSCLIFLFYEEPMRIVVRNLLIPSKKRIASNA